MKKYAGITMNGLHSWHTFRCRLQKRIIGQPEKKRITETVPYSNAVYNFTELYGAQTYGERELQYVLVLREDNEKKAQETIRRIMKWLNVSGYTPLYDDMMPDGYFLAEPLSPQVEERNGLYLITVRYKAAPLICPLVPHLPYTPSTYPDLDGDGAVTAADAALILSAASAIGAGGASGLTPEQEVLADVNRDGSITAADAAILSEFTTAVGAGRFSDTPEDWAAFMNARTSQEEGML